MQRKKDFNGNWSLGQAAEKHGHTFTKHNSRGQRPMSKALAVEYALAVSAAAVLGVYISSLVTGSLPFHYNLTNKVGENGINRPEYYDAPQFVTKTSTRSLPKAKKNKKKKEQKTTKIGKEQGRAPFQFPSINERIEYYMGNWNNVTSIDKSKLKPEYCTKDLIAVGHNPGARILGLEEVSKCIQAKKVLNAIYCRGVLPFLIDPKVNSLETPSYLLKVLTRPGDRCDQREKKVPIVVKARGTSDGGKSNILWPLNVERHYKQIFQLKDKLHEIAWEDKNDTIIWRGANNGKRLEVVKKWHTHTKRKEDIDIAFDHLTKGTQQEPQVLRLVGDRKSIEEMAGYRYLLSMEGNDVASGLKWMLWTNSVVFMKPPRCVSWAMEDKLQPFVHFIPLNDNMSNLPEMLKWARENQEECRRISSRATEFMMRLIMSDQAKRENEEIMNAMRKMYQERFGSTFYEYCSEVFKNEVNNS